jgi:DNA processing protein
MRTRPGLAAAIRASHDEPHRVEAETLARGGWLVTPLDATYPARLHDLVDAPPVLYGLGCREALDHHAIVAVVGTRRPTGIGRDLAARIATRLAVGGATVISGLAIGIDAVAHGATLDAGGTTVGVSGSGLHRPAPRANDGLARRLLAAGGAIIGELAPRALPTAGTFPRRNRIISALAAATIVVEAPARSGALITARHALEQGRRVFAVPGRPLDPAVAGCLALLRDSPARPVVGLDELIEDLELERHGPATLTAPTPIAGLSSLEREIAQALAEGPQTADRLIARIGQPAGQIAAALTILQLRGFARPHGSLFLAAGALLALDRRAVT